jgi:putative membrane protein
MTFFRITVSSLVAAALAAAVGGASAQQSDRVVPPAASSSAMAPVDETFALYASSASLAQIEGANLVLKHAQRAESREFAQTVLRANTQMLDEVRRIAAARALKIPPAPTGRHADMVTKLSGVAGPDVEDAFLQRFGVDAHKETIALYERHAKEGREAALRKHAQTELAALRERMTVAQKLLDGARAAR